ncbi:LacI family DNA-binding transcriptional regulator [soil metagenome]
MPVRLIDVAERAGVSIATASRSLNGTPGVSPEMAARVQQVATSMGFVANSHARSLAGGQQSSIGLVVGAIDDPYFSEIAAAVIAGASATGRAVQIAHADSPEELVAQIRVFRSYNLGAIVLAGSGSEDPEAEGSVAEELDAFTAGGGRAAVIGRRSFTAPAVLPRNYEGGRLIGEHLLSLGHRRIAVVAGPAGLTTVADRLAGLLDALGDAEVTVSHQLFTREGGIEGARRALDQPVPATAIAALSDVLAIGVLGELRSRGIDVPAQMSLTGFDDVSVAADLAPSLTTVRLDLPAIGAAALSLTAALPSSEPAIIEPACTLVVRHSTGSR